MRATTGAVTANPSVTIVKSDSERYMAAEISMLEISLSKITVSRYPPTLRREKMAFGCMKTRSSR